MEYIKDDSWKIQSEFEDFNSLIQRASEVIKEQGKEMLDYSKRNMGYPEYISINLKAAYEKGVVYESMCNIDNAAGKYDTFTHALLIVENDGQVKCIIDSIDGRVNNNSNGPVAVNGDIVNAEMEKLGKRIDGPLFDESSNFFNKKKKQAQKELTHQLVETMVNNSSTIMENAVNKELENSNSKTI